MSGSCRNEILQSIRITYDMRVPSMSEINIWPVHFADDIPRWRVVTFDESGVIVAERTFHDEEEAREFYNTLKGMNGR